MTINLVSRPHCNALIGSLGCSLTGEAGGNKVSSHHQIVYRPPSPLHVAVFVQAIMVSDVGAMAGGRYLGVLSATKDQEPLFPLAQLSESQSAAAAKAI